MYFNNRPTGSKIGAWASSQSSVLKSREDLSIAIMKYKKFDKMDFKKLHPAGNLGAQLKTVEDIMLVGNRIPFVSQNLRMKEALKILSAKKLGVLIVQNNMSNVVQKNVWNSIICR